MTLDHVKQTLDIVALDLSVATDKDNNPTDWFRQWDDTSRTAISVHKDTVAEIQADDKLSTLGIQTEERTSEKGEIYTSVRVVNYKNSIALSL